MPNHEDCMRLAIEEAKKGDAPFGAVITKDERIILAAHDSVVTDKDPTAHAEINALRRYARAFGPDGMADCTLYVTCEPCPMCVAACILAGVSRIVYGASMRDARKHRPNIDLAATDLIKLAPREMQVTPGILRAECKKLYVPE